MWLARSHPNQIRSRREGLRQTWDGTFYADCNDGSTKACAKSGHYTAHFCAFADRGDGGATCEPANTPTCVDVPFDWPTTGPVKGTLPP